MAAGGAAHWDGDLMLDVRSKIVGLCGLGLVIALAGFAVGVTVTGLQGGEHHETRVICSSARGTISCELEDDWSVAVPQDVLWTGSGSTHEGSRPSCLPASGRASRRRAS